MRLEDAISARINAPKTTGRRSVSRIRIDKYSIASPVPILTTIAMEHRIEGKQTGQTIIGRGQLLEQLEGGVSLIAELADRHMRA